MAQPEPNPNELMAAKVDLTKDKLSPAQIIYMKMAQQQNAERVTKLRKLRRSNLLTAAVLGVSVASIFGYSIWAVGNEKFLEEGYQGRKI